jgi:signal transduction histidine kinase
MHPVVVQAGLAIPLVLALVVHTAARRERSTLQWLLAGLLLSILAWIGAISVRFLSADPAVWSWSLGFEELGGCAMPPLFFLTMAHWGRLSAFEKSPAAAAGIATPFAFFFLAYLTNDSHHLMIRSGATVGLEATPSEWGGPLFWALQLWAYAYITAGLGICLRGWARARSRDERRRALLIVLAIFAPVVAHTGFILELLPLSYPLTPAALGGTALLLVTAIHRYGLLETRPVVQRDVIQHLHDGLLLADEDGAVFDANPAAERTLLRPAAPAADPPGGDPLVEGEGPGAHAELECEDGRAIEVHTGAVRASESGPAGRFVVMRDRTAQRRSELRLRRSQKLESVGILAAGIAHEVNNPLAFVRANLAHLQQLGGLVDKHLAGEAPRVPEELGEIAEVVEESLVGLDRIGRIVEGLLRFSRAPAVEMSRVDVNQIVDEAIRLAVLHRSQSVVVEVSLAEELPQLLAFADRLVQVVLNLLLNAKQALCERDDGQIRVETGLAGGAVEIRIRDNGPGVAEDLLERIFDPFFTTRSPGEGTGLGLSIAFDIVREHGGSLEVGPAPGGGALFTARLPAADDDPPAAPA